MLKRLLSSSLILACTCGGVGDSVATPPKNIPLIPRSVLMAKPDKFCVKISPDGRYISYFARSGNEIELRIETLGGQSVRSFKVKNSRNMFGYTWCYTNEHILIGEDNNGDENDHVLCLNIKTGEIKNLTPFGDKVKSHAGVSKEYPNYALVASNKRNAKWFDLYKVNILTGECQLIFENNAYTDIISVDFEPRVFIETKNNGDMDLFNARTKKKVFTVKSEDMGLFAPYQIHKGQNILYTSMFVGGDKACLAAINLDTGEIKTIYSSDKSDVSLAASDRETHEPQIVEENYLKSKYIALNPAVEKRLNILKAKFGEKDFYLVSRSQDDSKWILATQEPDEPTKYFSFDWSNSEQKPKFMFSSQKALESYKLCKMEPVVIKSRDGLDLVCYLTKACNYEEGKPGPMVAYIHGGPWARDDYGFNKVVQLLANRGYSVLQINYRGSTGFGKKFFNAIDKNLESVRNDIIDAAQWAIDQKIADKNRIAIMGGSFGGYSALAGLTFTPDFFCCGVDVVGPSNYISLLSNVPKYWKPGMACWYKTAGNPENEDDIPYLKKISPLFHKDRIKKPLIVFQGANDPRVAKRESDQIVDALKDKKIPVTYVLYPDEGHGFLREPNSLSYLAITEKFLAKFLGGWFEPYTAEELKGSTYQFVEGENWLK